MWEYLPRFEDVVPLLPGAGAGVLFLLAAEWLIRRRAEKKALFFAGAAPAAVHIITFIQIRGAPPFPPVQATERMVYAVAAFAAGGILAHLFTSRWWIRGLVAFGLAGGLVFYGLKPLLALPSTSEHHVAWSTALLLACGIAVFWIQLENLAPRLKGPGLPLTLSLVCGLGGQILLIFGAASLAQLSGGAALFFGAASLILPCLPQRIFPPAAAGAATGVVAGCGLDGYYFISETPPALSLLLIAAAPQLLVFSLLPKAREMRVLPRFLLQMGLVLIPLALALWIALEHLPRAAADPYGGLYD